MGRSIRARRGGGFCGPGRNEPGHRQIARHDADSIGDTADRAPPTANLEAYDYYLRGEQAARTGRASALREALDFYAKAVELSIQTSPWRSRPMLAPP